MKKFLSLALSAAMVLTLAACSNGTSGSANAPGSSGTASTSGGSVSSEEFQFTQPINVIVPFKAGSATDNQIRLMQSDLEKALGTTLVIIMV